MAATYKINSEYDRIIGLSSQNAAIKEKANPYIVGGLVNGIAGPSAGLYAAYQTDQKNRALEKSTNQFVTQMQNRSIQNESSSIEYTSKAFHTICIITSFLDKECGLKELRISRKEEIKQRLVAAEKAKKQAEEENSARIAIGSKIMWTGVIIGILIMLFGGFSTPAFVIIGISVAIGAIVAGIIYMSKNQH